MPPSRALQIERIVKRVDNAIHNPSIDYKGVKSAMEHLKYANISPYREDYDHWIHLAIERGDETKLCCLFGSTRISGLLHLLKKSPSHIPMYMKSPMFNPNRVNNLYYYSYDNDILEISENPNLNSEKQLTLFFQQSKSWPVLKRLGERRGFKKYFGVNPVAKKRKQQRKIILRFWLLTTKSVLKLWRESLYAPGTGALYKKAAVSFGADQHNRLNTES